MTSTLITKAAVHFFRFGLGSGLFAKEFAHTDEEIIAKITASPPTGKFDRFLIVMLRH